LKSIKFKLIIALSIGFILVLAFIILNNNRISTITSNNNQSVINHISTLSNEYISYRMDKSNDIALIISNNSHLNIITRKVKVGIAEVNTAISRLASDIMYQAELNEEIESIYIYLKEENIFIDSYKNIILKSGISSVDWIKNYANTQKTIKWVETKDTRFDNLQLISLIYRADSFNSNISSPVYISINFKKQEFMDLIEKTKIADQTAVALVNYDDDIFICNEDELTNIEIRHVAYENKDYLYENGEIRVDIKSLGKGFLVYTQLEAFDGAIIHIIPDKFTQVISNSEKSLIIISGVAVLLIYLMTMLIFFKKNIDAPISKMLKYMKKTGQGQFNEIIEQSRNDEFGQLYIAYNKMVKEIEGLIQELYQEQLVKRELELKVLQEKINPHFLYNTLDTINWIAKEHNIDVISKMVLDLSTMYRMTFNKGKDLISIKDLVVGISCYLAIQKIRYGDSFTYQFNIDTDLMEHEILNLIVQTLIENTIIHGMKNIKKDGKIQIIIKKENEIIKVVVQDNGIGLNKEKLQLINASINSNKNISESGLRNVQKRVRLFYGMEYGIKLESIEKKGTKVTMTLPLKGITK